MAQGGGQSRYFANENPRSGRGCAERDGSGYLPKEAQCPPEGAWPEPMAMIGDSRRRFTGAESSQSQTKKAAKASQKTRMRVVLSVAMMLVPVMFADAHTRQ